MNILGIGIPGYGEIMFLFMLFSPFWLLPLIALISILKSDFKQPNDKIIWVLVSILLPILGPILYFIIGRQQRVTDYSTNT